MNLYAVVVNGEEVAEFIARSLNEAYYKARDVFKIKFLQGVKIIEILKDWCERDF